MSVSVEMNHGSHGSRVARGSDKLLEKLFEGMGLSGRFVVRVGQQTAGGPDLNGIQGAKIRLAGSRSPRTVIFTIQPGDNGTRREFMLDVPSGTEVSTFISRFSEFVENHQEVPDSTSSNSEETRTVVEIRAHLQQLRAEQERLPTTFTDQERALEQRENEIVQRERKLAEERRKLAEERAELKQEMGRLNTRRRQLEEAIGMAEMELEDAEQAIVAQARRQLEVLAASTGMSLDQLLLLAQHNGRSKS